MGQKLEQKRLELYKVDMKLIKTCITWVMIMFFLFHLRLGKITDLFLELL